MKYFYTHIIETETITVELDSLKLNDKQKVYLAELVDSTIHHTVLDVAFTRLSSEDRRVFAEKVKKDPTDKTLMDFLHDKIDNIEEEIAKVVEELKKDLHKDILEAKRIGGKF